VISASFVALLLAGILLVAAEPGPDRAEAAPSRSRIPTVRQGQQAWQHGKQDKPLAREPFGQQDEDAAAIPGFPGARIWADSQSDFANALPPAEGPWLVLSGGGADGAYGAGLLVGWSASGSRPRFAAVTGVSTGALMASYAFLGEWYDGPLREIYTTITAADVFEHHATPESLLDSWPLRDSIARRVTPELLADIASEHRGGRRLLVVTTNIDAERPVVWNMGAIALRADDRALKLFRDILLASASIPGVFPPVAIDVEAHGRRFQELHTDGAAGGPFFVAPQSWLTDPGHQPLPAKQLFIVVNSKLAPELEVAERSVLSVLSRSISVSLKTTARAEIAIVRAAAQRSSISCQVATIDERFSHSRHGPFDPDYMRALFDLGFRQARDGAAFGTGPGGFAPQSRAR
jgi:predicted acylesterase/phospholipase RssA